MTPSSKTLVRKSVDRSDNSWEESFVWAVKVYNFVLRLQSLLSITFAIGSLVIIPLWYKMYESAIYEKEVKALELMRIDTVSNWKRANIISVIDALKDLVDLSRLRPDSLLTLEDARRLVPDPAIVKISDYMARNALPVIMLAGFCSLIMEHLSNPWLFLDLVFGDTSKMPLVSILQTLIRIFCPRMWLFPITCTIYIVNLVYNGMNRMVKGRLNNGDKGELEEGDATPDGDGDRSLEAADGRIVNNRRPENDDNGAEESHTD